METFTSVMHPHDPQYQLRRKMLVKELSRMSQKDLTQMLRTQADYGEFRDDQQLSSTIFREVSAVRTGGPYQPEFQRNSGGFLDTGGNSFTGTQTNTTGGVLIRQDLEAPAYALFLKVFPFFDHLPHEQANGLVHTAMQITSPEQGYSGTPTSLMDEVSQVAYKNGVYQRATYPIAVFAQGRGVGLKEIAAVTAGGVNYDPMGMEMSHAMVRLAQDVQTIMFQGNASNSSGTSAQEAGNYVSYGFDGLRGVLGSVGSFSGNNALQLDMGALNLTESLQVAAAKLANVGGRPNAVIMSLNSKQALDIEQQANIRWGSGGVQPGNVVSTVQWADGTLSIVPIPGSTMGTYNRTSDGALVEDVYLLDEATLRVRYLYSDGFTVLQIPTGVDGYLSMRYLVFGMFGLEIAAPIFCGKVRRLAA